MKRTDLIALAERLSDARVYGKDIALAADFLRQIAQAQPVAWMYDGFASTNKRRVEYDEMRNRSCGFKARPIHTLYTLPLED